MILAGRRLRRPLPSTLAAVVIVAASVGAAAAIVQRGAGPAAAPAAAPALRAPVSFPPGSRPAPAFRLHDLARGGTVSTAAQHGRVLLVAFLDSHCRSLCPVVGGELAAVGRALAPASRPAVVVVSVDPADTAASVRTATRHYGWRPSWGWRWAGGSASQLRPVWRRYGIGVRPAGGDIEHGESVYLIDRGGFMRAAYLPPFRPADVEADVLRLEAPGGA